MLVHVNEMQNNAFTVSWTKFDINRLTHDTSYSTRIRLCLCDSLAHSQQPYSDNPNANFRRIFSGNPKAFCAFSLISGMIHSQAVLAMLEIVEEKYTFTVSPFCDLHV